MSETSSAPSALLPQAWLQPLTRPGCRSALPHRIVPGAMQGVSDGVFAELMNRLNLVDSWITPFIRLTGSKPPRDRILSQRLERFTSAKPVIVQLMGTDIALLAATAARLAELGASGIDLNCACPTRVVVSNGAGGGLLRQPDWIYAALVALRAAVPCMVSVKLRSGYASAAEMQHILPAVQAAAPDMVILHFRTVREAYLPVAGALERFAEARALLPQCLLLASGDMFSVADARQLWRAAQVDGVTVARGLMRNPWLLRQLHDACRGVVTLAPTPTALLAFLDSAAELCQAGNSPRIGQVLQLAQAMFGADSEIFAGLARLQTPTQARVYLQAQQQHKVGGG